MASRPNGCRELSLGVSSGGCGGSTADHASLSSSTLLSSRERILHSARTSLESGMEFFPSHKGMTGQEHEGLHFGDEGSSFPLPLVQRLLLRPYHYRIIYGSSICVP